MKVFRKTKRLLKKSYYNYRRGRRLYFRWLFYVSIASSVMGFLSKNEVLVRKVMNFIKF